MSRLADLEAAQRRDRARLPIVRARIRTRRAVIKRLVAEQGAITMFDDTNLALVPAHAEAVAGYLEGALLPATYPDVVKRWPHSKHLAIAVMAGQSADCLDIETGDAAINQAPWWFHHRWVGYNTALPWLYTSASNLEALIATMAAAGIARHAYFLWSAHYTHDPHICGPHSCGYPQANGAQWTDLALGRSLDQSKLQRHGFTW